MTRLSAYASRPQYWRHMAPVVAELERRGQPVEVWAKEHEPWAPAFIDHQDTIGDVVIVASFTDAQRWRDRPNLWLDHGAGQTYDGAPVADRAALLGFPGSPRLEHVALFCAPSERVAQRWRDTYPGVRTAVVGCPALDRYAGKVRGGDGPQSLSPSPGVPAPSDRPCSTRLRPVVAFTCHHRQVLAESCPEQAPALPLYLEAIRGLDRERYDLCGHGHPRIQTEARRWWDDLGLRFVEDIDEVLSTADLLVVDNSSVGMEAAAIGLPVLTINSPTYRREVEHGLRFWRAVPGLMCDTPDEMADAIAEALEDAAPLPALRKAGVRAAYAYRDGNASARAADAILSLLEDGVPLPMPNQNPDVRDQTEELEERLRLLGADDDLVALLMETNAENLERMRRLNDSLLAGEIVAGREILAAVDAKPKRGRPPKVKDDEE